MPIRPALERLPNWVTDAALAAALVAAALVELAAPAAPAGPLVLGVSLAGAGAVALRRVAPLVAALAASAPLWLLTWRGVDTFAFGHLVAILVTTYTLGHLAGRAHAAIGLAFALVTAVANSASGGNPSPGDVVFPLILVAGPWLAGRALCLWQERAQELHRLNGELVVRREEAAALAVAAERGLIARELHDSLAQSLQVIVVNAEAADATLDGDRELTRASLDRIRSEAREALTETRRTLGALRSGEAGRTTPGLADLDRLSERVRSAGLDVVVRTTGAARPVPAHVDSAAYRIVQEGLTNVLKHAGAEHAWVELTYADDALELDVTDDGRGDGTPGGPGGHGLLGMRERTQFLGGCLVAGPRPAGGFQVHAVLPLRAAAP